MKYRLSLEEIENGFRLLGLKEGMFIEVHSSLSSFGYVVGGADTVIKALKNVITRKGAIIIPAFPLSKPLPLTIPSPIMARRKPC